MSCFALQAWEVPRRSCCCHARFLPVVVTRPDVVVVEGTGAWQACHLLSYSTMLKTYSGKPPPYFSRSACAQESFLFSHHGRCSLQQSCPFFPERLQPDSSSLSYVVFIAVSGRPPPYSPSARMWLPSARGDFYSTVRAISDPSSIALLCSTQHVQAVISRCVIALLSPRPCVLAPRRSSTQHVQAVIALLSPRSCALAPRCLKLASISTGICLPC